VLPPFLLLEDSYTDVQSMTALLKRIGLVNAVRVIGSVSDAQRYLADCVPSRLPVVVFIGAQVRGAHGLELLEWMRQQPDPIAQIGAIALVHATDEPVAIQAADLGIPTVEKPVEMRALIAAMKSLGLPEKAKIDVSTLTVQVELWPRGTRLDG
jgi:DNA-binding response OmpR family regulator